MSHPLNDHFEVWAAEHGLILERRTMNTLEGDPIYSSPVTAAAREAFIAGYAAHKPLTPQQIADAVLHSEVFGHYPGAIFEFVRDIEAAHGITDPGSTQ